MNIAYQFMTQFKRSLVDSLFTDLEKAKRDSRLIDKEKEFDLLWAYEKERARTSPGYALSPKEVFQILVMIE